jgi:hypothetical protein
MEPTYYRPRPSFPQHDFRLEHLVDVEHWVPVDQDDVGVGYFDQMHLVKPFKSLAEAPPSGLISQIGPTGDDYFGSGPRDTEYMEPGVSHQRTAAVSVSY